MNELALFTGAGGGLLGSLLLGWRPVCGVEIDRFCREILLRRQRDGMLPLFPIWDDIRTFDGRPWRGKVDVVTGGFPCQPWSTAGARRGEADDRNLWPDTIRVIREVRPIFALLENVEAITFRRQGHSPFVGRVLADLAASGYDAVWDCIPALAVGAPHSRWRWWCLAYAAGSASPEQEREHDEMGWAEFPERDGSEGVVADTSVNYEQRYYKTFNDSEAQRGRITETFRGRNSAKFQSMADPAGAGLSVGQRAALGAPRGHTEPERFDSVGGEWWAVEPDVGRVAHGVASRMDRLRALGNGQVPDVVVLAWKTLMERVRLMEHYG